MAIQVYTGSFGDQFPSSGGSFSTMLDRFFNDSVSRSGGMSRFAPSVDAYETEHGYEIEASLPGLRREDIKVEFQQGRLTISGERRAQQNRQDQNRRYHLLESQYGSFSRSFQLPDVADAKGIEAHFEDGILRVTVPKNEEKTKRHQIAVGGGQNNGAPSGQLSDRMGQQATDVPVEAGDGQAAGGDQSAAQNGEGAGS